jgi:Lrp/AsnC family transcriptional regulator of ectoine degradation
MMRIDNNMKKYPLDAVDIRILSVVQQHGQVSKSQLSELVNLSPTPCWLRLTKLKKAGLITGYRGLVAVDKAVDLTTVFVSIALKEHRNSDFERFKRHIQSVEEIVECYGIGGGTDYMLKVVTCSLPDFQTLIGQLLDEEIGIDRYYVYVVISEVKTEPLNLSQLMKMKSRADL